MRTRRNVLPILAAIALALSVGGAGAADPDAGSPEGWQGLLGSRPAPQLGGRWIVVFGTPSLADRLRRARVMPNEATQRRLTRAVERQQDRLLARLASHGIGITPEHRYLRVLNGFSAPIDPRVVSALDAEPFVAGVYPVRAAYPARTAADPRTAQVDTPPNETVGIPGFDGGGVEVALLDTGVDLTHPFIRSRLLRGIDVVDPGGDASARQNPTERGRAERHGTELAGIVAGDGGPAGLAGVAPGALVRPIRVAGWQPDGSGGVAVYARTDQVLAGLEAAVDPNGDGDAHDAARIALVGLVEPFASFEDGPLSRAAAGAAALDTLVVAPAGNDGPAGPSFGSVGGPGGAGSALAVAAIDDRSRGPTAHVLVRSGLQVLTSGEQPLGGTGQPAEVLDVAVTALAQRGQAVVGGASALERLFDSRGYSKVAGRAALLPSGPPTPEAVLDLARAGARAVLVDGPLPAGALGVDDPEIPILGLSTAVATEIRRLLKQRLPVRLSVGAVDFEANPGRSSLAPFSSDGLAFGGTPKPELAASGVGILTSAPGRQEGGKARYDAISGSSAAAAVVAGSLALLAHARPDLDALSLRNAVVATASPVETAPGTTVGVADPSLAASAELVADPPLLGLGVAFPRQTTLGRGFTLRNTSRRTIVAEIAPATTPGGTDVSVFPTRVRLRPGRSVQVGVAAAIDARGTAPSAVGGTIRITPTAGGPLRVGWTAAVPVSGRPVLARVSITPRAFRPSDRSPAVLTLTVGRVDERNGRPSVLPLAGLELQLLRNGRRVGALTRLRNVLPGRYAFGITGRGPRGGRLAPGAYQIKIVADPVTGDVVDTAVVPFAIERPAR